MAIPDAARIAAEKGKKGIGITAQPVKKTPTPATNYMPIILNGQYIPSPNDNKVFKEANILAPLMPKEPDYKGAKELIQGTMNTTPVVNGKVVSTPASSDLLVSAVGNKITEKVADTKAEKVADTKANKNPTTKNDSNTQVLNKNNEGGGISPNFEDTRPTVDVTTYDDEVVSLPRSSYADEVLGKLNDLINGWDGRTSYTDRMNEAFDKYMNREKFNYNPDEDINWQNYLSSAMRQGNVAMQDTMGQAAALTGGYGSSYASSVGSQAYNQYLNNAYDNMNQFYQMAYNQYNQEGEDLYNQFKTYAGLDEQEYARKQDDLNNLYNLYKTYNDKDLQALEQENWLKKFNRDVYENDRNYNRDIYENDRNYNRDVIEADRQYQLNKDKFNADREDALKNFNEGVRQFEVKRADSLASQNNTSEWQEPTKKASPSIYDEARNLYWQVGGGKRGEVLLIDFLEKYKDYDIVDIYNYALRPKLDTNP